MIPYIINQKESEVRLAYENLISKLDEYITLRAKEGLPISSLVGLKRTVFRNKKIINANQKPKESNYEREELEQGIAMLVEDVFNKMGVDVLEPVKAGLIGDKELKKALIKYDYFQMAKQGIKYKVIKQKLSEKYGFSVSSIEKMVYRKM